MRQRNPAIHKILSITLGGQWFDVSDSGVPTGVLLGLLSSHGLSYSALE